MVNTGLATGYLRSEQSLMDQAEAEGENEVTDATLSALAVGADGVSNSFVTVPLNNSSTSGEEFVVVGGVSNDTGLNVPFTVQLEVTNDDGNTSSDESSLSTRMTGIVDTGIGVSNPVQNQATELQEAMEELQTQGVNRPSAEIIERVRALTEPPSPSENDGEVATNIFNYYNDRADLIELQQTEDEAFLYNNLSLNNLIEDTDSRLLLLSHENYKISMQPESVLFGKEVLISNGPFIDPEQLYLLKKGYIENKLESFSNRYFLKEGNSKKNQSFYLQSIRQNNTFRKNYITDIREYLDNNSKNIKNINFGNQLVSYAKDNKYSNYFGKVVNKLYNSNTYDFISSYTNNNFDNINGTAQHSIFDKSYHTNLINTLTNYYKLNIEIDENSNNSFFYKDDILNSNAIIAQCLNFSAAALKNIHEGSFTSVNYDNTSDLNFSLYDSISNNRTLSRLTVLPYVFNYDIFNSNSDKINFTCSAYSNTLSLSTIKSSVKNFTFKNNSNYISSNYSSNKIQTDHFILTNILQRSVDSQNKIYYLDGISLLSDRGYSGIRQLLENQHNWLITDQILGNRSNVSVDEFGTLLGIDPTDYLSMQYNALDTDAIITQSMRTNESGRNFNVFYLTYFDTESQIRNYENDATASNIEKYLSCPTFNVYSFFRSFVDEDYLRQDESYANFIENHTAEHVDRALSRNYYLVEGFKGFGNVGRLGSLEGISTGRNLNFAVNPFNLKQKKFEELDRNRIMFGYGIQNGTYYSDSINTVDNYQPTLSYFVDRMWTIKRNRDNAAVDRIDDNKHTQFFSPRNLDFREIGYGGAAIRFGEDSRREIFEQYSDWSVENGLSESVKGSIPSIKNMTNGYAPFVLLKNTNKIYDFNSSEIKNKYLKDNTLTTSNELFYDRVQVTSSTRSKYLSDDEKNIFKKYQKLSSWKDFQINKNNWVTSAFRIKRNLFKIKQNKLANNSFLNFLEEINNKNNKLFNNKDIKSVFSLLHEDELFEGNKLYSFEESPFLIKKDNNVFVEKNNYKNSFDSKILTTNNGINLLSNDEISNLESFTNVNEFKNFLNEYYPESCLKNSSSLIQKMFSNITDVFNKYNKNYIKANKEKIGFEDLIVSSLISNRETFNFLYYAIIENKFKERQLNNESSDPENFYHSENKKSEGIYNEYLTNIFSIGNVKKQNTFTLRVIGDKFLNLSKDALQGDPLNGLVGRNERRGFMSTMDGRIKNYLFPYKDYSSKINNYSAYIKDPSNIGPGAFFWSYKNFFATFLMQNTYNYDVYLHSQSPSLFSEENIKNNKLNISCNYIVLHKDIGEEYDNRWIDPDDKSIKKDYKLRSFIKFFDNPEDQEVSEEDLYDRIPNELFYELFESAKWNKDFTFDLIEEEEENTKTFLASLSNLVEEILNYSFTKKFLLETKTTEIIKSDIFDSITSILIDYVKLYKNESDKIRELSIFKQINTQIRSQYTDLSMENDKHFIRWDDTVKNQIMLPYTTYSNSQDNNDYNINSLLHKYSESETNIYSNSQQVIDNTNIISLLRKSDYLESLTHDLILGYLLSFEDNKNRLLDTNREKLNLEEKIKEKSQEIINIQGDINFTDFNFNKFKVCKASKLMQNKAYYSIVQENNIDAIMRNRISNSFDNFKLFETKVKFEKNKKELADHAIKKYFLRREELIESFNKIDILRFGISYNLANSLGIDKIMMISVYPINHKYPEIRIPHFEFLYTPIFTDIVPAYLNTNDIGDLSGKLGLYDINNQRFDLKYRLSDGPNQFNILYKLLQNIEEKRTLLGFKKSLQATYDNIERIKTARKISNAIKYLNDSYNSIFDDANINELDIDFDNVISDKTKVLFDELNENSFKKIFNENKEEANEFFIDQSGYFDVINKQQQIERNIHSTEFFKNLDENISNLKFLQPLANDSFFDIFSVRISRDGIRNEIAKKLRENNAETIRLRNILSKDDFSNSYSYIIQTKVF